MAYPGKRRFSDKSSQNLEGRVSAVETAVEHIEATMDDVRDSVRAGFMEMRVELENQADSTRPKVVAWAGWAAVVVLVIGMFGSGYVRDLNRLEKTVNSELNIAHQFHLEVVRMDAINETKIHALEREVFIKEVIVNGRKKDKRSD